MEEDNIPAPHKATNSNFSPKDQLLFMCSPLSKDNSRLEEFKTLDNNTKVLEDEENENLGEELA
jgi:hypothetical protein